MEPNPGSPGRQVGLEKTYITKKYFTVNLQPKNTTFLWMSEVLYFFVVVVVVLFTVILSKLLL